MRKTYAGTSYQYRKVRDLESVKERIGHTQRALLRIEYRTKSEPDTLRVCYAIKHSSWSFRDVMHWYHVCDENGECASTDYRGSTVGDVAEAAERRRSETEGTRHDNQSQETESTATDTSGRT